MAVVLALLVQLWAAAAGAARDALDPRLTR